MEPPGVVAGALDPFQVTGCKGQSSNIDQRLYTILMLSTGPPPSHTTCAMGRACDYYLRIAQT